MPYRIQRLIGEERGAVLALVTLFVPVLLGILGLVIDNGYLYSLRRDMQTAADATALTAAQEHRRGNDKYADVAREDAEKHGFKPGSGVNVDIDLPPKYGPFAGDVNYVEVRIRKEAPMLFMKGLGLESKPVEARAVVGLRPRNGCIWVLNRTEASALDVGGVTTVEVPNCTVWVNSASSTGAVTSGNATLTALATQVAGGYSGSGFYPTPEKIDHFADPLASLPEPPFTGCTHLGRQLIVVDTTLNPGTYCGGIEIRKGTVTFRPGVYHLLGGLSIATNGNAIGDGVMFYNSFSSLYPYNTIDIASNGTVDLKAPSSGVYRGVLIFQSRAVTTFLKSSIVKSKTVNFEGALYFPSSGMKLTGGGAFDVSKVVLIVDRLELRGGLTIAGTGEGLFPIAAADARLVE